MSTTDYDSIVGHKPGVASEHLGDDGDPVDELLIGRLQDDDGDEDD